MNKHGQNALLPTPIGFELAKLIGLKSEATTSSTSTPSTSKNIKRAMSVQEVESSFFRASPSIGIGIQQILAKYPVTTKQSNMIPEQILDDLVIRFVGNIPEEERDPIRVCFQIELAHWFFVDFYCGEGSKGYLAHLSQIPYNVFANLIFQRTPFLQPLMSNIGNILQLFKEYKCRVPTYGGIMLDKSMTHVLLVQGFRGSWGFPKGKVNEQEDPLVCAHREVLEETDFDASNLLNPKHFIESSAYERKSRLYIIRGVSQKYPFKPQTRYEIKNIAWFKISELPENKKDSCGINKRGYQNNQFFSVFPFTRRLKMWIKDKSDGRNKIDCYRSKQMDDFVSIYYHNEGFEIYYEDEKEEEIEDRHSPYGKKKPQAIPQQQQPIRPLMPIKQEKFAVPLGIFPHQEHPKPAATFPQHHVAYPKDIPNVAPVGKKNPKRKLFEDPVEPKGNMKNKSDKAAPVNAKNVPFFPILQKGGSSRPEAINPFKGFCGPKNWTSFTLDKAQIREAMRM